MTDFPWTAEAVAELKSGWDTGMSASKLAAHMAEKFGMPVTRNMICGKVHRLKLPVHTRGTRPPPKPRASRAVRSTPFRIPLAPEAPGELASRILAATEARELPVETLDPQQKLVALADLTDDTCRWPMWDDGGEHLFCGAMPLKGRPYCCRHFTLGTWGR